MHKARVPARDKPWRCDAGTLLDRVKVTLSLARIFRIANEQHGGRLPERARSMQEWADESHANIEPRPYLEAFYILVALELGNPNIHPWVSDHSAKFHRMYEQYCRHAKIKQEFDDDSGREGGAAILLSYMLWYERNQPAVDTSPKTTHDGPTWKAT